MHCYNILLILLLPLGLTYSQSVLADSLFQSGNQAMVAEEYARAAYYYGEILSIEQSHQDLYYNLGNAYYRQDLIGQAIWAYKKGLELSPRDKDLKYNLLIAKTFVRDRVELPDTFFLLNYYRKIKNYATTHELLLFGSILLVIAIIISSINKLFFQKKTVFSRISALIVISALLTHGMVLEKLWQQMDNVMGIVVENEINVYSSPFGRNDAIIFKLHEGLEVEINQGQSDWVEITLLDGNQGWVEFSKIRVL
ncbi:SH3 domain-containing protein [Candidatus Neomarinimicrobiota bacterium]